MRGPIAALECAPELGDTAAAQKLRRWSAPSLILALTDFADEEKLLFNVIRQATHGGTKIVLANVLARGSAWPRGPGKPPAEENGSPAKTARAALEQMARQLRWVGLDCEPILVRGDPSEEIQEIVDSRGVDRIILTQQCHEAADSIDDCLAEELLRAIAIPICMLGPGMPLSPQSQAPAARVTLALAHGVDCGLPMAFASRLAQKQRAKLTVLHVFDSAGEDAVMTGWTPEAVSSLLLAPAIREAERLCPVEIVQREGDAAAEIPGYVNSTKQDFLVLAPDVSAHSRPSRCAAALREIVNGARCPVLLLGNSIVAAAGSWSRMVEQPQPPHGSCS
jgi:nucleotide-binding universal stress UspA family protein